VLRSKISERRTYQIPGAASEVSSHRGYALWAPLYDGEENPLSEVEEPAVAEILQDLPYSRVLDAASGTGRHALRPAAGGIEVTAVDRSAAMMEIARAHADREGLNVRHVLASIEQLPLASQRFDRVLCALAPCPSRISRA
jgi:2-polyprenyl-3-methyl-5-hydroxy-6-metoxy-1,4-benzoquinol methylase